MPLGEHLLAPAAEHVDAAASADVSEHCKASAARADVAPPPSSEAQHAAAVLVGAMKEIDVSPDSFMPYDDGRDTEKDYVSRLMTFVGGRAKHHYDDLLEQVKNLLEQKEKSESVTRVLQAAASSERQVMMKRSRSIEHELNAQIHDLRDKLSAERETLKDMLLKQQRVYNIMNESLPGKKRSIIITDPPPRNPERHRRPGKQKRSTISEDEHKEGDSKKKRIRVHAPRTRIEVRPDGTEVEVVDYTKCLQRGCTFESLSQYHNISAHYKKMHKNVAYESGKGLSVMVTKLANQATK